MSGPRMLESRDNTVRWERTPDLRLRLTTEGIHSVELVASHGPDGLVRMIATEEGASGKRRTDLHLWPYEVKAIREWLDLLDGSEATTAATLR